MNKILLLSNVYPTARSPSSGSFIRNIERGLEDNGMDIKRVVVSSFGQNKVLKLLAYLAFVLKSIAWILFSNRTVYVHFISHSGLPLFITRFFKKSCVVSHVHGADVLPEDWESAFSQKWKRRISSVTLAQSKKVVVPSESFINVLQKNYDIASEQIVISPSGGLSTELFTPVKDKIPHFQSTGKLILGCVGRLDYGKGVDTLIGALSGIDLHYHCYIVGSGTKEPELRALVRSLNLTDNVTFVPGKAQEELVSLYQRFDYLIFPSELNESLGLVGLEAMATGTPVIGSMMGGMTTYIADRVNGFAFDVGNKSSLSECLNKAVSVELTEYQALSVNAIETASRFDSKAVSKSLAEEFNNL